MVLGEELCSARGLVHRERAEQLGAAVRDGLRDVLGLPLQHLRRRAVRRRAGDLHGRGDGQPPAHRAAPATASRSAPARAASRAAATSRSPAARSASAGAVRSPVPVHGTRTSITSAISSPLRSGPGRLPGVDRTGQAAPRSRRERSRSRRDIFHRRTGGCQSCGYLKPSYLQYRSTPEPLAVAGAYLSGSPSSGQASGGRLTYASNSARDCLNTESRPHQEPVTARPTPPPRSAPAPAGSSAPPSRQPPGRRTPPPAPPPPPTRRPPRPRRPC